MIKLKNFLKSIKKIMHYLRITKVYYEILDNPYDIEFMGWNSVKCSKYGQNSKNYCFIVYIERFMLESTSR